MLRAEELMHATDDLLQLVQCTLISLGVVKVSLARLRRQRVTVARTKISAAILGCARWHALLLRTSAQRHVSDMNAPIRTAVRNASQP